MTDLAGKPRKVKTDCLVNEKFYVGNNELEKENDYYFRYGNFKYWISEREKFVVFKILVASDKYIVKFKKFFKNLDEVKANYPYLFQSGIENF